MQENLISRSRVVHLVVLGLLQLLVGSCSDDEPQDVREEMIMNVDLVYNPTGIAPLSAQISWSTEELVSAELVVKGSIPIGFEHSLDTSFSMAIHGLYAGDVNELSLRVEKPTGEYDTTTLWVSADPLPEIFPEVVVNKASTDDYYLLEAALCQDESSIGYPMVIDADGQIRWFLNLSEYGIVLLPMTRMGNGNFISFKEADIYEIDMLGNKVNQYRLPGHSGHHDIQETSDGHLIILTSKVGSRTIEDYLVEFDPETQSIVKEWDFANILDVSRHDISMEPADWLHANSVEYDEEQNTFLISGRHQGIFEMSYEGELNWIIAPHNNWGQAGRNGDGELVKNKLLTAINNSGMPYTEDIQLGNAAADDFDWSWGQHSASALGDAIYCFDNGWLRQYEETGFLNGVSRAVKYTIDRENMEVQQEWEYKESDPVFYSAIMGDLDILSDSRVLSLISITGTGAGPASQIIEIDPNTNIIYTDIIAQYKAQNCIPGLIFGSFEFAYRAEKFEF